jgi:serine/threonine protein kinase
MPPGALAEGLRISHEPDEELEQAELSNESSEEETSSLRWGAFQPSEYLNLGIDRFELLGQVGSGPFGDVYFAIDNQKDPFAIKIPMADKITSGEHANVFFKDAEAARSLRHPNILSVMDYGFWQEKIPFIASRQITAPSLRTLAAKNMIADEPTLRRMFTQICSAVNCAHRFGLIHRHLHPNNIFIEPGPVLIVSEFCVHYDGRYHFNLFEPLQNASPFDSPEAINNNPDFIDHRNDIYALGKILKLMLRITLIDPNHAKRWERIIEKCTHSRRRDRYQSVRLILDEIEKIKQLGS